MFKGCIFDCDGTIANTLESIAAFGNAALEHFDYKTAPVEKYRTFVGNGADKLIRRMLDYSIGEYDEETVAKVRKCYDDLYEADPMKLVKPYPGISHLLEVLRINGVQTAVLSNKPDNMTKAVVSSLLGAENFRFIQGQLPDIPKKPDPTAPLILMKKMDLLPCECLYIGDSGVDIETARNSGMKSAGVTWGFRGEKELREYGADFIINSVDELEKLILE